MTARVLLVDDTEMIRLVVRISLERDGRFTVVGEAANGREGVERAVELQPDLVVMDLSMPVMDGIEATRLLQQQLPDLRVVVLTGFAEPQMLRAAREAGACELVEKGGDLTRLADVLADTLENC
ncbi:response regulator [Egicoccus halophilus]|uniref:Response regulatory domain-containing protein n=1 Tax=Egicoccus halophilus TaxID=1670830 RepID=A0A8J3EVC4_9ACTN|nr:response regulator transcription factor [Egicoccus halophilus]GGI09409.1 hypothetical protein GCM10011354_33930 [Egicoccus halophilus]